MKLMASAVTFSAAMVRSPSFSRSSSSTTMTMRPARMSSMASSMVPNSVFRAAVFARGSRVFAGLFLPVMGLPAYDGSRFTTRGSRFPRRCRSFLSRPSHPRPDRTGTRNSNRTAGGHAWLAARPALHCPPVEPDGFAKPLVLHGRLVDGLGEGQHFTVLDWVRQRFRDLLGIDLHPGTLDLLV